MNSEFLWCSYWRQYLLLTPEASSTLDASTEPPTQKRLSQFIQLTEKKKQKLITLYINVCNIYNYRLNKSKILIYSVTTKLPNLETFGKGGRYLLHPVLVAEPEIINQKKAEAFRRKSLI